MIIIRAMRIPCPSPRRGVNGVSMRYCFKRRERISEGLDRIARDQLDGALKDLRGRKPEEGVYQARKRLKKLRAVLRLARPGLDPAVFDRENTTLRDVARQLSVVRDADVLVEVIEGLRPHNGRDAAFRRVVSSARIHRRSVRREFFNGGAALNAIRDSMSASKSRLADWAGDDVTSKDVLKGLRRSYSRARQSFESARRSRDDTRWHEWRKRTKDFWYHLRLFERVWPPVLGATISRCRELADRLGEDHDLVVIRHRLTELAPEGKAGREANRLRSLIAHRHDTLRAEAREAGARLFGEKPGAFMRRVDACWRAWRK
jgi:CHAD domain-containing protein